jgi:hypothetical protein
VKPMHIEITIRYKYPKIILTINTIRRLGRGSHQLVPLIACT